MSWRLLTREEIKREYPRAKNIVAAAGLTNDEGELYSDAHVVLHGDGTLTLSPIEIDANEMTTMLETLKRSAAATIADAAASERAEQPRRSAPA